MAVTVSVALEHLQGGVDEAELGRVVHALLAEVSLGAAVPVAEAHEAAGHHEPQPGGAQRALFFVIISVVGAAMGLVTTVPGQPAIMTTLATEIAASTGWPIKTVLLTQPLSWTMAMFAYQFPPFILAAHLAGISMAHLTRLILAMCATAWILIMPLLYLWWQALGYFK